MTPADIIRVKELLPTSLGSDELRERVAREILRRSVFSARMAAAPVLARMREVCAAFAAGVPTAHADPDDLRNPAAERRLDLIIETQRGMAASAAQILVQDAGTLDRFPAWLLTRLASRRAPRGDWDRRWRAAGEAVGWAGACPRYFHGDGGGYVALKGSPIWQALGDGAGGFRDALGNPFPPFAYASGLGWLQVDRATCERLGLLRDGEGTGAPAAPDLSPGERDIADAARRYGLGEAFFE